MNNQADTIEILTDASSDWQEWLEEFEAAARRTPEMRMRYAFIKTYKPVLDDATYRSFDSMEDYRRWCEDNLPSWLGYGRV
ncbi:MAG TPA: hypothetical protein VNS63_25515 [Blastocatellia bacterium]|nr:hypothetical protein [Blastocatellia bacterium]